MKATEAKRLKGAQVRNARLKKLLAEAENEVTDDNGQHWVGLHGDQEGVLADVSLAFWLDDPNQLVRCPRA